MSSTDPLAELLERWDELRSQGQEPVLADLCADRPELCTSLAQRVAELKSMDWLDATEEVPFPALAPPPQLRKEEIPTVLAGRYRLTQPIASGGFGQVWRAIDSALERAVAVKLTRIDCRSEARRVAQLRHHGIITVHDVGNEGGWCFIVFDLVEGTDLATRLQQGPLPWRDAVKLVAQLAEHLHHAHQRGFIHRDIKPANILLDERGQPVLADFGIAITPCELEHETHSTPGTLAYMAPELLTELGQASVRSDVWSLGAVLYETLTGQPPFTAKTLWELRRQILTAPLPALTDVPPGVAAACLRCLQRDPAARFGSAQELAQSLRGLLATPGETMSLPGGSTMVTL